ncbi:MAG: trypsin-like peptidase domain-containing protein [Bryobacteraceae bacterium]
MRHDFFLRLRQAPLPGAFLFGLLFLLAATAGTAKTFLAITSQPPGASVELDGIVVGTTPYSAEIPSSYVRGGRSVFTKFLRHQIHLRLTLSGYLPKEVDLANGPTPFITLNGVNHGDIWILKSDTFNFILEKAATTFTGNVQVTLSNVASATLKPAITTEEIVRLAGPAVLVLRAAGGSGSGFLVGSSGIAVTNAHVARGQSELIATCGNGQSFQAKVVYVDTALDIALLKLEGTDFPRLQLADTGSIQPGSPVVAIGTPSKGFQNSVTKGVVGGIGPMPGEPGTWIQTDASINPGNSGGPLLNSAGEVVGVTTQKPFVSNDGWPLQGIGFAISSNDLLSVLGRFYPNMTVAGTAQASDHRGKGKISITADLDGADIFIDARFVGNAPAVFSLPTGLHRIEVRGPNGAEWHRDLEVLEDSDVSLRALLRK